jgi:ACS family glucarate transporter-like MFS transporter
LSTAPHVRWNIVLILCALAFVLYLDRINIAVAAPHIASEFSLSRQSLGNILSAFLFGYALGLVPGGWLADRFGPHRVLTAAALCWAAISVLTGLIGSLGHPTQSVVSFVLARFTLGLCEACAFPTFNRAIANWMHKSERARASGLIHCGSALGGSFTPVFIAFVVARFGWRESFVVAGTVTLLVALWWTGYGTSEPRRHKRVTEEELRFIGSKREESNIETPDRAWYRRLICSRNMYMLLASELFYGLAIFVVITWFYIYFTEIRHVGPMQAASLSSLPYLAMAIGAPTGGFLSDIAIRRWENPWGRRIVPLVVLIASGICAVVAPLVPSSTASASLFALGAGFQFAAAAAFWATVIDITRRGAGILGGLMNASGNLGQAIGTVSFPWFVAQVGWEPALQLAGACAVLSGLLWMFIDSSCQLDTFDKTNCVSMQSPVTK